MSPNLLVITPSNFASITRYIHPLFRNISPLTVPRAIVCRNGKSTIFSLRFNPFATAVESRLATLIARTTKCFVCISQKVYIEITKTSNGNFKFLLGGLKHAQTIGNNWVDTRSYVTFLELEFTWVCLLQLSSDSSNFKSAFRRPLAAAKGLICVFLSRQLAIRFVVRHARQSSECYVRWVRQSQLAKARRIARKSKKADCERRRVK